MAFRSYVLAGLETGAEREDVAQAIAALEAMPEVTFADPVVGSYGLVVGLESSSPVEELVERIQKIKGLCNLVSLKVNPVPCRARMHKNLEGIPQKRAPKKK
jgi:DUF1009 family protein